jgi:hypothetical protein
MLLNDEQRQQLLPFGARLACADTARIEWEREAYINLRTWSHRTFEERLDVLEGALAIGRQADMLAPEEVANRLEAAQQSASRSATATHSSKLAKLKTWFAPAA